MSLQKNLPLEVALKGVTVNCVAPGAIETEMSVDVPQNYLDKMLEKIPARLFGAGDDVARAVLFLRDDAASYISDQVILVNDGWEI